MANYNTRGSAQNQSIVMRCCAEDKSALKLIAAKKGTTMSELIRNLLIQEKWIEPSYMANDEI